MWNFRAKNAAAERADQPFLKLAGTLRAPDPQGLGMLQRLGLGFVADLIYSDGTMALVVAEGATALINLKTGQNQWEIDCPGSCGALSPDGSLLALGRREQIYLWNLRAQRLERQLSAHDHVLSSLTISPDGRVLASGGYQLIIVWDLASGGELCRLQGHEHSVKRLEFTSDGKFLISVDGSFILQIWDVSSWSQVRQYHGSDFAISRDAQLLAIAGTVGPAQTQLEIFDLPNRRRLSARKHDFILHRLLFSPDSTVLAAGSTRLHFLDGRKLEKQGELGSHPLAILGLAFCSDGTQITTAGRDGTLRVWHAKQRREALGLAPASPTIAGNDVVFSRDGKRLVSADIIGNIHIWDSATWRQQLTFEAHTGQVHSLAISPDGLTLASGGADGNLRVWNATTGRQLRRSEVHGGDVYAVAISRDGKLLASGGSDGTALLWTLADGRKLRQFFGHDDAVNRLAFSPDGKLLAAAGFDTTLRLWELATGKLLQTLKHGAILQGIAFSADGREVTTSDAHRILRRWDVASGCELARYELEDGFSTPFALDSEANRLAVGGLYNGTIHILEANTGRPLRQLPGHLMYVDSLDFSPNGSCLASSGGDGTVRIWDVSPDARL